MNQLLLFGPPNKLPKWVGIQFADISEPEDYADFRDTGNLIDISDTIVEKVDRLEHPHNNLVFDINNFKSRTVPYA